MTENRHTPSSRYAETLLPGVVTPHRQTQDAHDQQIHAILPPLPFQIESWVVTEILASGGMGVTFLASENGASDRKGVLKMPLTLDPDILNRFRNEIRVLADLDHPNIVKFLGSGEALVEIAGQQCQLPWLAMEFVPGQSLRAKLLTSKRMSWQETYTFLESVLGGLVYLHRRNLCHRDIKPDNLIHDPASKNWKLVDFGIAKNLVANPQLTMTLAQSDPGALDYMSPEQLAGNQVDTRSDIYSLGKTAWEALIGQVPRVGTPYPSVELGASTVPPDVDKLIEKMVAHRPESRFQEPSEVLEALATGMSVIDRKKRAGIRGRKIRRFVKLSAVAAVVLSLTGFILKGLGEQKIGEVYDANIKISATHALHGMESFKIEHPIWAICGARTLHQKMAEIGPKAETEYKAMLITYNDVEEDLRDDTHDDSYKLGRADAFTTSYSVDFAETQQLRDMHIKRDNLLVSVVTKQANDFLSAANDADKKGDFAQAGALTKQALLLCDKTDTGLAGSIPQIAISKLRNQIAADYSKRKLGVIQQGLNEKDEGNVLQAQTSTLSLEKELFGANSETQSFLRKLDDDLWAMKSEQYKMSLEKNDFSQASEALDDYENNSVIKGHKLQAEKMKEGLREAQDDADWKTVSTSAQKNFDQQAFHLAAVDYANYLNKWLDKGKHSTKAQNGLTKAMEGQFDHMTKVQDYDDFRGELKQFMDDYPDAKDGILAGQRLLVSRAYDRLCDVCNEAMKSSENTAAATALDKMNQLNWDLAETEKRNYLETFRGSIRTLMREPNKNNFLRAQYYSQRPPKDCVEVKDAPTVFMVTLKSIDVNMSDKLFGSLKGMWNSKPRLIVNVCSNDKSKQYPKRLELSSTQEGIESKSFSQPFSQDGVYVDTENEVLVITLKDDATMGFSDISFFLPGDNLRRSGQAPYTAPDGTQFTVSFTAE